MLAKVIQPNLKAEIGLLKRERILHAAAELFAAKGFHNVSMGELSKALGVTKPFVYSNFRDKNDLLFSICSRGAELTFSAVEASKDLSEQPLERFALFCRSFAEIVIDNRTFITVYSREEVNLSQKQRKKVMKLRIEIDQHIATVIGDAVKKGDADAIDPLMTATAIGVMMSALWYWYREKGPEHREHIIDTLTQLALRMIGANR